MKQKEENRMNISQFISSVAFVLLGSLSARDALARVDAQLDLPKGCVYTTTDGVKLAEFAPGFATLSLDGLADSVDSSASDGVVIKEEDKGWRLKFFHRVGTALRRYSGTWIAKPQGAQRGRLVCWEVVAMAPPPVTTGDGDCPDGGRNVQIVNMRVTDVNEHLLGQPDLGHLSDYAFPGIDRTLADSQEDKNVAAGFCMSVIHDSIE